MDRISILSIALVSFPEALCIALLGLLSIGKASHLRSNSFRIKTTLLVILIAVVTYFIRRSVNSDIENLLVYILLLCILYIIFLKLTLYEAILATSFGFIILVISEAICLTPLMAITGINAKDVYLSDLSRVLISIPERILQVFLIFISFRYSIKIMDTENTNLKKKNYYIQLAVYFISISTLIFLTIIMTRILFFNDNPLNPTNTVLLRINIYLTLFITIVLTLTIRNTSRFYKKRSSLNNSEIIQSIDYVTELLNNGTICEAKSALSKLKSSIDQD